MRGEGSNFSTWTKPIPSIYTKLKWEMEEVEVWWAWPRGEDRLYQYSIRKWVQDGRMDGRTDSVFSSFQRCSTTVCDVYYRKCTLYIQDNVYIEVYTWSVYTQLVYRYVGALQNTTYKQRHICLKTTLHETINSPTSNLLHVLENSICIELEILLL